ncbi:PepSY domain-containing protein [Paenibacillus terreus]|uniref:PepSY domain-containing protein n=1 Tax=Paenibacillus terreus TaxID=1387834 RepID=A0ABV5B8F8_9BACL
MKPILWSLCAVLLIAGIISIGTVWNAQKNKAAALSEEEAVSAVLAQYPGEVLDVSLQSDAYLLQMKSHTGLYELKVDAEQGSILSIERLDGELSQEQLAAAFPTEQQGESQSADEAAQQTQMKNGKGAEAEASTDTQITSDSVSAGKQDEGKEKLEEDAEPVRTARIVTDKEAKNIALQQVQGKVEDVDFRTEGGVRYYLVEIDTPDEREAIVQVNAISGVIMSVAWDEEDDPEEDDE